MGLAHSVRALPSMMCVSDVAAEDDADAGRCAASLILLHSPARLGQAHASATPKVDNNAAESMRCLATPPQTLGEHDNSSLGRTRDHTAPHHPVREAVGRRVDHFSTSRDSHFLSSITHLHKHQANARAVRRRRNACKPGWGRFNLLVAVACISFTAAQVTGEGGTYLWNCMWRRRRQKGLPRRVCPACGRVRHTRLAHTHADILGRAGSEIQFEVCIGVFYCLVVVRALRDSGSISCPRCAHKAHEKMLGSEESAEQCVDAPILRKMSVF